MISAYKYYVPEISIIMAVYNRAGFLDRSIGSVISQSFTKWELVIVDDGSTDAAFETVNKYLSEYENIKYIKHKNRKLALTRNAGILASSGKYITFLDSDDEYKKEHLELRYNFFLQNPDVDFVHGGVEIIGDPYVKDKNDFSKSIHLNECAIGGTFFAKRELFLSLNGFFDIPYSEDSELYERAVKIYKIKKVDYPTYIYYRNTPDSICNNI